MVVVKESNTIRKTTNVGEAAITMAIGIVIERVSGLPVQDRQDLFELVKALETVGSEEELEAIRSGMVEILDQEKYKAVPFTFDTADTPAGLTKWNQHVDTSIRALREAANKTQVDLARECGLTQSHISRIEHAELSPSHRTVDRIAKSLGVEANRIDPTR